MMNLPLSVALIGCGGRGKAHVPAILADSRLRLVAVADARPEAAEALVAEYGFEAAVFGDHQSLLREVQPEIVVVALWTDLHIPVIRDCVANGARAILCEKPMARTWSEYLAIGELAEQSKVQITFCHQRRFAEGNRQVRQLIADGRFGKIERMDLFSPPHLLDCGTHSVDQALSFRGEMPIKWAHGAVDLSTLVKFFNVPAEGSSTGMFAFEDGVVVSLRTGGPDLDYWSGVRAVGSEGFVEILWDGQVKRAVVYAEPEWTLDPIETSHDDQMVGYVRDTIDAYIDGREPETSHRYALRAGEVLFALYESARRRERIDLPISGDVNDPLGAMLEER